jgi:uncharacterized damage-inducible protein DinB
MAFIYPRSEPGSGSHLDLVEAVRVLQRQTAEEVEGLSEEVLQFRPAEGEWSIKEVCGHLLDNDQVWHQRLQMTATQENPLLPSFDQEALVRERNYDQQDIRTILDALSEVRTRTTDLLADLVQWKWARPAYHWERGRMSIRQMVELEIGHDRGHLKQIRRLKEQGAAEVK